MLEGPAQSAGIQEAATGKRNQSSRNRDICCQGNDDVAPHVNSSAGTTLQTQITVAEKRYVATTQQMRSGGAAADSERSGHDSEIRNDGAVPKVLMIEG